MTSSMDLNSMKTEPQEADESNNDASSSWIGQKKDIPGTPTPENPPSSPSSSSSGPDDTCSICLGRITEKCVTDSCLHGFCLLCLKEWSKQKAVCPLCKLSFTKIMYDIKSESDYKEWVVPQPDPVERNVGIANFQEFLNAETRRFFGYRTTHFPGAATLRRWHFRARQAPDAIPSLPPQRRSRFNLRGSRMFRLSVYLNDIWVQPLADVTGRFRQTSPQLYREQPALTHRLVPWVNRELTALVSESRIAVVLAEVIALIERYPINSREFRSALEPHLAGRTRHFVHEFYHFARSPYDMVGHDNAARYIPRYQHEENSSDNSDNDSDAIVEVDSAGNPVASTSAADAIRGQSAPGNVVREETLTNEGSVVISSSEASDEESERPHSQEAADADLALTSNPEPPPSLLRHHLKKAVVSEIVNEGASTSRVSSVASRGNTYPSPEYNSSDSDNSEDCFIIDQVVPKAPSPELIEIDSDEEDADDDQPSTNNSNSVECKTPAGKENVNKLRGKSKPTLKRNNFSNSEYLSQGDSVGDRPGNIAQQDHSYCTEEGSSSALPATSDTSVCVSQEPQGSSNNVGVQCSSSQGNSQKELSSQEISRIEISESDPSLSEEDESSSRAREQFPLNLSDECESPPRAREQLFRDNRARIVFRANIDKYVASKTDTDRYISVSKHTKRKHGKKNDEASPVSSKRQKLTREHNLSIKLPKKDLKAKIKSSSDRNSKSHSVATTEARHRLYESARAVRESSSESLVTQVDIKHKRQKKRKRSHQKELRESSERRLSSSSKEKNVSSRHQHRTRDSSSEDSDIEVKGSGHRNSSKHRSSSKKKSFKKHKSRDKHHERSKRSKNKKNKHKKRSKGKRRKVSHESDSEYSDYRKHELKLGHKKRHSINTSSDSWSSSPYVKFKETTVKLKIRNDATSSYSSDWSVD